MGPSGAARFHRAGKCSTPALSRLSPGVGTVMKLRDLLSEDARCEARFDELAITGLPADGRPVAPGVSFVGVPGTKADGLAFVAQAFSAGAVAVMAERAPPALPPGVAFVQVGNVRRAPPLGAATFEPR